jgi:TolB protein
MVFSVTRRSAAGLLLGTALAPSLPAFAQSHRYLDITGGQFKPVNIAVTNFGGEPGNAGQLTSIVTNNFKRSVFPRADQQS